MTTLITPLSAACLVLSTLCSPAHTNPTDATDSTTTPLALTGYALIGETPYVSLLDTNTQERFLVTYSPNSQNNHLLSFRSESPTLQATRGTALIKNEIRAFQSFTPTEEKLGDILLYSSHEENENPTPNPFESGEETGRLAALETLVLLEALEHENPQNPPQTQKILLHLLFHPLPPQPSPEDLQAALTQNRAPWDRPPPPQHKPPAHLQPHFEEEAQLQQPSFPSVTQTYYLGYQEGWTEEICSVLASTQK
jgi:hypothetical protein